MLTRARLALLRPRTPGIGTAPTPQGPLDGCHAAASRIDVPASSERSSLGELLQHHAFRAVHLVSSMRAGQTPLRRRGTNSWLGDASAPSYHLRWCSSATIASGFRRRRRLGILTDGAHPRSLATFSARPPLVQWGVGGAGRRACARRGTRTLRIAIPSLSVPILDTDVLSRTSLGRMAPYTTRCSGSIAGSNGRRDREAVGCSRRVTGCNTTNVSLVGVRRALAGITTRRTSRRGGTYLCSTPEFVTKAYPGASKSPFRQYVCVSAPYLVPLKIASRPSSEVPGLLSLQRFPLDEPHPSLCSFGISTVWSVFSDHVLPPRPLFRVVTGHRSLGGHSKRAEYWLLLRILLRVWVFVAACGHTGRKPPSAVVAAFCRPNLATIKQMTRVDIERAPAGFFARFLCRFMVDSRHFAGLRYGRTHLLPRFSRCVAEHSVCELLGSRRLVVDVFLYSLPHTPRPGCLLVRLPVTCTRRELSSHGRSTCCGCDAAGVCWRRRARGWRSLDPGFGVATRVLSSESDSTTLASSLQRDVAPRL
uniref:Uncharacterized protein n=1 Tax=Mycena chlorophos TaxID=658473 RepID=A0ABQ0LV94_MYCCL|nr:predicted protein [Mycena chlorophos]